MSECIVRMEMPERCYDCDMADGVTCMATGGVYGREVPKMTWIRRRPDWCPIICSLPEGHGRLVDKDEMLKKIENYHRYMTIGRESDPRCIIEDSPTIVPAEAERSEKDGK